MKIALDADFSSEMRARAKVQIRKRMKALRGAYSAASLITRSDAIVARLAMDEVVQQARSVALFWPMQGRGEVDLRGLDSELRLKGVAVYYPFMRKIGKERYLTGFAPTETVSELVPGEGGFLEPVSHDVAKPGDVDLVIVPALAADARGHRIGYGAGFYDATLGDVCPPARSLCVAYHFQLLSELPAEEHDRACDGVMTDETTLWCNGQ